MRGNILRCKNVIPQAGQHPTEKPIKLLKKILLAKPSAYEICDPFCGSGTTLLAAKQLGRKAVGIEISQKYCDLTVDRLLQTQLNFH